MTETSRRLQQLPGVGPSLAQDLIDLGYTTVEGLRGEDPEVMYQRLMALRGGPIDRCVLYVFRGAVYFAGTPPAAREPDKLKWWHWKEGR
ncbi:MAG: Pathogenicity locus [Alphaproteobacteria bacterium CG_4_10_14_0_2_um_filter_63_37]|nr:MAG: Pathogenicity locus [Proteobacteria bacterium CG1_02_64_396]PJA24483.1 MAG: Pathogenicity locus [Alphaproteobacteria bacterium CG_4_10_14_0_2_um_filter_63_37]